MKFFENFDFKVLCFLKFAQFLTALFIILVGLTMTWFSGKMLISHRCIHGLMANLIKKYWTISTPASYTVHIAQCSKISEEGYKKLKASYETLFSLYFLRWNLSWAVWIPRDKQLYDNKMSFFKNFFHLPLFRRR